MSKTICILIQVSDLDSNKAFELAGILASQCDDALGKLGCSSWRSAFPIVTNQDLMRTLKTPLMQIEDGKEGA